ncbi:hypothetical protein [Nesterenkonia flava]|uniref:Uncharacterized protein n=1 Tax=Nesterenkonia flava TaxID=469799 RepID=A0ABU1FX94_9MICC|nr:hypothetical protein [Nesterenkonia flava]MDR5712773.1 hypothetical protein [Nesterenkonia flava]
MYDAAPPHPAQKQSSPWGVFAVWAVVLVLAIAAAVVAIWQVNERIYTPEAAAEQYWEDLSAGNGSAALGHLSSVPEFVNAETDAEGEGAVDHLLLSGDPLQRSIEQLSSAAVTETEGGAELNFTVGEEDYSTAVPLVRGDSIWGFFDDWQIAPSAVTWFEVEVPGAPQGGIGQVQVNGEPVNLDQERAALSAFVPTAVDIEIDSQWLVGSAQHVVLNAEDNGNEAHRVTIDLEASDEAVDLLHTEIQEYFDSCDQPVLMPAGCPVGVSTNHQVDPDTIDWEFPDPEVATLTFDAEGWHVSYDHLVAEVSFQARHHHTGEQLTETEQVSFGLDIQVGASGEDLIISVTGR